MSDMPISGAYRDPEPRTFSDKDDLYSYYKSRSRITPYAQRETNIAVMEYGIELNIATFIIAGPLIYGRGTGPFHKTSIQLPLLIRDSIKRQQAAYIADGSSSWSYVHVTDFASLYETIISKLLNGEKLPSGKAGVYFAESGNNTWLEIADRIGQAGLELGTLRTKVPVSLTLAQAAKDITFGSEFLAELGFGSR